MRHEYGHVEQLKKPGISRYTTTVVLPSVICFYLDEAGWLPEKSYYNLPYLHSLVAAPTATPCTPVPLAATAIRITS